MGALLGTALIEAGKEVRGRNQVGLQEVARMVSAAAAGVQERGKAGLGDKTMLDALIPAAEALERSVQEEHSLLEALRRAQFAAEQGAQSTSEMKAAFGRARWLGERTIGHLDPGATAISLVFCSIVRSVEQLFTSRAQTADDF
jgi:dihydroxyacetone kinase-like protein